MQSLDSRLQVSAMNGVVRREEQYLERKFGDAYRQYMASVARYGFI